MKKTRIDLYLTPSQKEEINNYRHKKGKKFNEIVLFAIGKLTADDMERAESKLLNTLSDEPVERVGVGLPWVENFVPIKEELSKKLKRKSGFGKVLGLAIHDYLILDSASEILAELSKTHSDKASAVLDNNIKVN